MKRRVNRVKLKQADSSLVSFVWTGDTKNYNTRTNGEPTRITIHHAANGTGCSKGASSSALTVIFESLNGNKGSVHYGIDSLGRIGQMLNEKYRPWTSDSRANDMIAYTMEICNDQGAPTYHVSDKALNACIELCVDICKRHNKKRVTYIADKTKALAYKPAADELIITLHKWFAATTCPEQYLTSKISYIAEQVTAKLTPKKFPYLIRITYPGGLNVRKDAGVTNAKTGIVLKKGEVYTIVEEQTVSGQVWGRLKSGAGWICLTGYTEKV